MLALNARPLYAEKPLSLASFQNNSVENHALLVRAVLS